MKFRLLGVMVVIALCSSIAAQTFSPPPIKSGQPGSGKHDISAELSIVDTGEIKLDDLGNQISSDTSSFKSASLTWMYGLMDSFSAGLQYTGINKIDFETAATVTGPEKLIYSTVDAVAAYEVLLGFSVHGGLGLTHSDTGESSNGSNLQLGGSYKFSVIDTFFLVGYLNITVGNTGVFDATIVTVGVTGALKIANTVGVFLTIFGESHDFKVIRDDFSDSVSGNGEGISIGVEFIF